MRRRSKARSKLAKAQRRKAEMPRRRAAPRLARERGEYARRDELRPIMETALDAVIVMKSDGIVADWNDRAVGVFGWSRDEAVGRILFRSDTAKRTERDFDGIWKAAREK